MASSLSSDWHWSCNSIPTLNFDKKCDNEYPNYIKDVLGECSPVWRRVRKRKCYEEVMVEDLRQTALPEELIDKDWLCIVRYICNRTELNVLLQKRNFYIVGYKGKDEEGKEKWILLNGRFDEKVLDYVKKLEGSVEPELTTLGTSYSSLISNYIPEYIADLEKSREKLEKRGIINENVKEELMRKLKIKLMKKELKKLKLNRKTLMKAVSYLKDERFNKKESAGHILILIQFLCEAARMKLISDHISLYYDHEEPSPLTDEMVDLIFSWNRASRKMTFAMRPDLEDKGLKDEPYCLNNNNLTADQLKPKISCIYSQSDNQMLEE